MKAIQQQIDQMIIHLGGYWRPLSGLARLLEEVGEVGAALDERNGDSLVEELLDVFVISTCLANQYAIRLKDQAQCASTSNIPNSYYKLVREAGEVARILNAYEGDKKLKATAVPGSLQKRIQNVQHEVWNIAREEGIHLYELLDDLIKDKSSRDFGRFDHTPDPITEQSVRKYNSHIDGRFWGGIEPKPFETIDRYKKRESNLTRFIKIAEVEGLDGFVILNTKQFIKITNHSINDINLPKTFTIAEETHGEDQFIIIRQKR